MRPLKKKFADPLRDTARTPEEQVRRNLEQIEENMQSSDLNFQDIDAWIRNHERRLQALEAAQVPPIVATYEEIDALKNRIVR